MLMFGGSWMWTDRRLYAYWLGRIESTGGTAVRTPLAARRTPRHSRDWRRPFDPSPPSTPHAPRSLRQRNFTRSSQVNQVLFLNILSKTDCFGFVLFMFVLWPHWRWSVYFHYGRLFTVSACCILYLCRSSHSWFMRREEIAPWTAFYCTKVARPPVL